MRFSISSCALLAVMLGAASSLAQTPPAQPAPPTSPCGPGQPQPPPNQPCPRWQQQPGQWQQQPPTPQHKPRAFESSLGLMMRAGGNLWTKPDHIDPGYDALGFAGSAGGFGWGGALYYEARIEQYLGLELDFGYDHSELHRSLTYKVNNVPFNANESVTASGVRWGLLAKAIAPVSSGRLWLGIGPGFISGSSVDGKVEITDGSPSQALRSGIENSIHETSKYSTMLTLALGAAIEVGEHVEIPIDLRAAKNLSQAANWKDRVNTTKLFAKPRSYDVTVQSSWNFRLGLGLGYRF